MTKAALRASEPVAADIRKMLGFLEFPFLARLSDMIEFNAVVGPLFYRSRMAVSLLCVLLCKSNSPKSQPFDSPT